MERAAFVIGILLLGYPYAFVARRLSGQWVTDPEMAHAVLVPVAIGLLVWRRWAVVAGMRPAPSMWGMAGLALGTAGYVAAVWGAGLFVGVLAGMVSLVGLIVLTQGWGVLRAVAGPLSLGVFAMPRLAVLYDAVTNPLAQWSAGLATWGLRVAGVEAWSAGGVITVAGYPVLVAESCSGLRFLVPLLFLTALILQMVPFSWRGAAGLFLATVPLAVAANSLRVGVLVYLAGTHQGTPPAGVHEWLGYPLYAAALAGMLAMVRRMRVAV